MRRKREKVKQKAKICALFNHKGRRGMRLQTLRDDNGTDLLPGTNVPRTILFLAEWASASF